MIAYPDTSFLYAVYVRQSNSPIAAAHAMTMREPLYLSELLLFEFRLSLRFQVWRRASNPREGLTAGDAQAALDQLDADLSNGVAVMVSCPLRDVLQRADQISRQYTTVQGHRSFDILHVATALTLKAAEFLSFDANQRQLATREGLIARP